MMKYLSLYLLMVLFCATICWSQDPIITLTANVEYANGPVGVYEGDSLMLTCRVQNVYDEVVGWIFRTTRIRANTNTAKYEVTTNGSLSTLTILNLMHVQDAGPYSCGVYLSDEFSDPEIRETLEILVYYFPDDMYPICNGPTVITEGEPVTYRCESEPGELPVDLTWRWDSGTVQELFSTHGVRNGKKFVEYIFLPSKNDNGLTAYCIISSNAIFRGKTSNCSVGPLSVQYPPTSISLTNQIVSYSNSTYDAILCSASAFPTDIFYTWSFNTFLDSSQQTLINGNQTLVILNVTLCEFPIIATCHASNKIGNIAARFTLCEPPPPPSSTTQLGTTTVALKPITSNGLIATTGLPIVKTDQVTLNGLASMTTTDQVASTTLPIGTNDQNTSNGLASTSLPIGTNDQATSIGLASTALPIAKTDQVTSKGLASTELQMATTDQVTSKGLASTALPIATNDQATSIGLASTALPIATNDQVTSNGLASTSHPIGTNDQATSIGLASTALPIGTNDQVVTTPQPPRPQVPLALIIILSVSLFSIALCISLCCCVAQPSCCSGQLEVNEEDTDCVNVHLTGDSRILNIANTQEHIPVDNHVFEMNTLNQQEPNIPQEQPLKWCEGTINPLEEVVINTSPHNPEEVVHTQVDSSNNTDFENNNPISDPENEDDGSQGKDRGDANQGQGKNLDKPALEDEGVDENFNDDGNQGNNQQDEETSDPKNPSSEPEEDQVEDKEAIDEDDIKDDEKMVDPPIIEVEADSDDPRRRVVQEALLATQVNYIESRAKRGFKRKQEMEP